LNPKGQIIWGSIMAEKIVIRAGGKIFEGEFNDGVTGRAIYDALPIRANGQRWGGEIYFGIGVSCELEEGILHILRGDTCIGRR